MVKFEDILYHYISSISRFCNILLNGRSYVPRIELRALITVRACFIVIIQQIAKYSRLGIYLDYLNRKIISSFAKSEFKNCNQELTHLIPLLCSWCYVSGFYYRSF
jgi:hypothetical protein